MQCDIDLTQRHVLIRHPPPPPPARIQGPIGGVRFPSFSTKKSWKEGRTPPGECTASSPHPLQNPSPRHPVQNPGSAPDTPTPYPHNHNHSLRIEKNLTLLGDVCRWLDQRSCSNNLNTFGRSAYILRPRGATEALQRAVGWMVWTKPFTGNLHCNGHHSK